MTIDRRQFLQGAAFVGGATALAGLTACSGGTPKSQDETKATGGNPQEPVITELPIPEAEAPSVTEYETDVLIVGAGFAGIPAAIEAQAQGKSVLLVDKGHPGYSGCSPFPQCYQFFNEEWGDDRDAQREVTKAAGEYIANLDWYNVYMDESKECFDQLEEWGIFERFPKASEAGDYFDTKRYQDYHDEFAQYDRRARWNQLLKDKGIESVEYTMITDVVKKDGRVIGAMGLHVPSGTVMTFNAKAVVLCMGGGAYKNGGWPMSGDTFDGDWIGYNAGASITGKEFTYQIATSSVAPTCGWRVYTWGYLENIHPVGGIFGAEDVPERIKTRTSTIVGKINKARNGLEPIDAGKTSDQPLDNAKNSTNPDDPRIIGNDVDPMPSRDIDGAAVGKGIHKCDGIFCGVDDLVGYTGIPGLYAAGDTLASMIYGSVYTPGQGGSVPVSHIQGRRAAKAAAEYADTVDLVKIDADTVSSKSEELLAPMSLETGFSPYWAQGVLLSIMAPYWVDMVKDEQSLSTALANVMQLQENVAPKLMATNSHDLRTVHEVKHKILNAEIKLRTSLERKESRGYCYRSDYPYRDDENFLCYITASKNEDGEMEIKRVPVKDEWKGDLSQPYTERYVTRLPGEAEALGLPE